MRFKLTTHGQMLLAGLVVALTGLPIAFHRPEPYGYIVLLVVLGVGVVNELRVQHHK